MQRAQIEPLPQHALIVVDERKKPRQEKRNEEKRRMSGAQSPK
jgi:hypothetical protein